MPTNEILVRTVLVPTNEILFSVRTVLVPTNEILFSVRTVLVPTNEVFEKLPASVRDSLKEDKNKTAEVQHIRFLTGHLKNGVPPTYLFT